MFRLPLPSFRMTLVLVTTISQVAKGRDFVVTNLVPTDPITVVILPYWQTKLRFLG